MPVLSVNTPSAAYDVTIGSGLLRTLSQRIARLQPGKAYRPFVVTSPEIWRHWSKAFLASFPKQGPGAPTVLFHPAGERFKRMAAVESLAQQMALAGADRDALLIAFGGGVIGDITGFLAAIYMRGVRYVQLPSTFLAQVDSSVGGKTGVNLQAGKNLIGSFNQPEAVFIDTDLLRTLPPAELRAGLQESIKAGIIYDARLFSYLEKHAATVLASRFTPQRQRALQHVITASVRVKAEVVSQDEKESGLRMILNFGHTLGHAIEAATHYKQLLHGEAVGWGSIAALHVALERGTITPAQFARMANLILRYGPLSPFRATAAKLVALTYSDKKKRSGRRAYVLPTAIGATATVFDVTDDELQRAAEAMLQLMRTSTAS
ncbi:MAG: 3-dehydroquinate synthase [Acidobacteriota bacterium]|nr:3-dehydroquinate synthase [Acidobacteriota bacterium]